MKKYLKLILIIFILFLSIFFYPWKMNSYSDNKSCEAMCKSHENSLAASVQQLACNPPVGGCFDICMGITVGNHCKPDSRCYDKCSSTCFGINAGTCTTNFLRKKSALNY